MPPPSNPDWFVLLTLTEVLAANDAARLPAALIKESGVASLVTMSMETNTDPDFLVTQVLALPGKDLGQVESLVNQAIERVAREGVTPAELERAQTNGLRNRALSMVTTTDRATSLAQILAGFDHPEGINDWESKTKLATSDGLRRVATKYLTPANRSVLLILPAGANK